VRLHRRPDQCQSVRRHLGLLRRASDEHDDVLREPSGMERYLLKPELHDSVVSLPSLCRLQSWLLACPTGALALMGWRIPRSVAVASRRRRRRACLRGRDWDLSTVQGAARTQLAASSTRLSRAVAVASVARSARRSTRNRAPSGQAHGVDRPRRRWARPVIRALVRRPSA
jgi:hypothetical protein